MIATILGFIPCVDRRLSIAIRSGNAAKVVPKPATNPTISDLLNFGTSKLDVSRGTKPSQPQSSSMPDVRTSRISILERGMVPSLVNHGMSELNCTLHGGCVQSS